MTEIAWARRLTPRHLEMLLTLSRTGSLSRTAQVMATTQPGISKWLRELERAVGAPLFARTTRSLAPTPVGEVLLRHARRTLVDAQRTHEEIEALKLGKLGKVLIGMLPGIGALLMPRAVAYMQAQGLALDLQLRESTQDVMLPELLDSKLDLLVARLEGPVRQAAVHVLPLFSEDVAIMTSAHHPLHRKNGVGWEDVVDERWILPIPGSPMRYLLESVFVQAGVAVPVPIMESASSFTNRAMALQHDCLFTTSGHMAAALEQEGGLRRLILPYRGATTEVGVLWVSDALAPQQQHVIAALAHAASAA